MGHHDLAATSVESVAGPCVPRGGLKFVGLSANVAHLQQRITIMLPTPPKDNNNVANLPPKDNNNVAKPQRNEKKKKKKNTCCLGRASSTLLPPPATPLVATTAELMYVVSLVQ